MSGEGDYLVTARKWRPMRFEDVVAQDHVTVTLRNAITAGRLGHAYLFGGPRGVGKTTTARILARAVNCLTPDGANPDNTCERCTEIIDGRSFDVLEIDGASNRGVEEIRNLRESVRYAPAQGRTKVYIIDEVHMLTKEAFNALLKTLEEPPRHVLFVFATTEVHKVPPTILSRCQRFDFRRISITEIIGNLRAIAKEEGVTIDEESLLMVAKKGDGSLRDAQSTFDQVVSLCGHEVGFRALLDALNVVDTEYFFRVTDLITAGDARGGLQLVDELMTRGHDLREFLSGLVEHLRNLLLARTTGSTGLIEASDHTRARYQETASAFSIADLLRLLRQVGAAETALRWSVQPRFRVEADLVQMITTRTAPEVGELLQQLDELKKKLSEPQSLSSRSSVQPPSPSPRTGRSAPAPPAARQPEPLARATPPPEGTPLGEAEIRARWGEFVAEVRKQKISLGSVLESAVLLGVAGGVLRIACANDFQASSIARSKELMTGVARNLFGAGMRVEVEIQTGIGPEETGGTDARTVPTPAEEHPVVRAIRRELGAEPVE